jgi:hypothetical protein
METPSIIVGKKITLKKLQESFFEEYHQRFSSTIRQCLHLPLMAPLEETANFLKQQLVLVDQGLQVFFVFLIIMIKN